MAFSVNDNGTWKTVKKLSVNDGTWKNVKSGWINKDGVWTKFYSSSVVTFIEAVGGGAGSQGAVRITIPTDASVSTTGAVSITTVGSNNLYLFTGNGTMAFN
jgi:hypothetical protein